MGAWEVKCQISQNDILRMKFLDFYLSFHNSCNLTFIFLDSHEKFFLVLFQMTNYIFSPWKT